MEKLSITHAMKLIIMFNI